MSTRTEVPPDWIKSATGNTVEDRRTDEDRRRIDRVFERMMATPAEAERIARDERRRYDRRQTDR